MSPPSGSVDNDHVLFLPVRPSDCLSQNLVNATSPIVLAGSFFKLSGCFCQGLKMCMTFGYNPQINLCHFSRRSNLFIFGLKS